jgi:hypothetical protein
MRAAPQLPSSFAASSKQRRMTSCGPAKVPPPGPDQLLPSYNSALAISRPKSMGLIAPQAGGHGGGTVTNPGFPTKHWRRTIYISKAFCGLSVSRGLPCAEVVPRLEPAVVCSGFSGYALTSGTCGGCSTSSLTTTT